MRLHVDNLTPEMKEQELRELFERYGRLGKVMIVDTGEGLRGDVDMELDEEAQAAVDGLDGTEIMGRKVRVRRTALTDTYL
jgi:RNA recognition motif-containing protein